MGHTECIWVRLEREVSDSWLETWFEVEVGYPREYLGHEVDRICKLLYPGWNWITYCVPEYQDSNGRPSDLDDEELVDDL